MSLTENGTGMYMPVAPAYGNNGGFGGFGFGGDGAWLILFILLACMGGWGNGGFGGFGGGNYDFPWLLNGQNGINNNVNDGFRTAQLSDNVTSIRDGIASLSTQLCGCCSDMQMALANGFAGVEQGANTRQIANMQTAFGMQTAMSQGFSDIASQLAQCCCDNRLATCQTQNIVQNEGNQTRFADANNTRDIIDSQTRGTQAILDKLCQLELDGVKAQIDAKNDEIAQLRQENLYARGQASQIEQNQSIINGIYNRLDTCPVGTTPVYGRTPIFTCNNNNGCGCGCGNF